MTARAPAQAEGTGEELEALIATLHRTEQRLEELTAGEVDTVADSKGHTFVLRKAQDALRDSEATRQAAILNALPAHIALLDAHGVIVSVNEAWLSFARGNALPGGEGAVGSDYLATCDAASGEGAADARLVGAGIRSVLFGATPEYSLEYPCHAPTERRWYLVTVTPLSLAHRNGAVVMHLDITERKLAAESLEQERSRLVAAQRVAKIGSWETDLASMSVIWSAETYRIHEADPATFHPTHEAFLDFVHPLDRAALDAAFRRSVDQVGPNTIEHRMCLPDGRVKILEERWVVVSDGKGTPPRAIGTCQDITERKRDEAALRHFTAAMDSIADVILLVDRATMRFVHVNDAGCRYLGRTREELLVTEAWVPQQLTRPELERLFDSLVATGEPAKPVELLRPRKDGSLRWVEVRRQAQLLGERWTIVTLVRDITERILKDEELQRFRAAMEVSGDAIVLIDRATMRYIDINQTLCDLLGRSRQEILAMTPMELFGVSREVLERDYDAIIANNDTAASRVEGEYRHVDGAVIPIETRRRALHTAAGWVIVGTARDITERKAAERRIAYLNRVYATLSGINTLIVRVRDRDELYAEACRIALEHGGFLQALICLRDPVSGLAIPVASAGMPAARLEEIRRMLASEDKGPTTMIARAIAGKAPIVSNVSQADPRALLGKEHGESGVRSLAVLPLVVAGEAIGALALYAGDVEFFHAEEMKLLTELAGDIAFGVEHLDKQARLDYLAYYDALTGLANRSLFLERVAQFLRGAGSAKRQVALFLIDIERFKNINDSLGRAAGDQLLQLVAAWMVRNLGGADFLGRVGADHFAAVLPKVAGDGAVAGLLEKWMAAFLAHPFHLGESVFRISAKVGVALFPEDAADAEALLRNAEAALKKAKSRGERYVLYKAKMNDAAAGKLTMENQLRQALDQEEFVLHYQPKVSLATGKLVSAEALIRWNDPRTGLVPPGRFIPILEDTGLINEVGRWALRKAIETYLLWLGAGLPAVRIAVNVSPLQLRNRGFIDEVTQVIGIDARGAAGLELEITESLIMEDVRHSIESLEAIRAKGVTVAIDDFGTGFSSLAYLARLPVDTLKIDRSFVTDMMHGPDGLSLVAMITNLAHSLKMKVVAEGVETEEQSRMLHLLGCDEMQGFLFSKAVPAEEFAARFLAAPAP